METQNTLDKNYLPTTPNFITETKDLLIGMSPGSKAIKLYNESVMPARWNNLITSITYILCYIYLSMGNIMSYNEIHGCAQLYVTILIPTLSFELSTIYL